MPGKQKKRRKKYQWTERQFGDAVRHEVKRSIRLHLIGTTGDIINNGIRYGWPVAIVFVVVWGWVQTAGDVAGKDTRIDIAIRGMVELLMNRWFYLAIIALLGGTVIVQRRTHSRRIAELAQANKELERVLDPKRSTSGLRRDGTTPED